MGLIGFLIEFIEDLSARKIDFKSIWALIRRNSSSGAKIYFFRNLLGQIRGLNA